jgi:protein SCO1/2
MKRSNLITSLVVVAILGFVAIATWRFSPVSPQTPAASDIGGPFQLVNQNGVRVDQRVLNGKWSAVYFGYTFCPDVCPTTLSALGGAQDDLGAKAKAFQVVFVTVDPQRDTPAQLRAYLSSPSFPKGMIGLTGTPAQIRSVAAAYRVYYRPESGGRNYIVDHSSSIYLMDPKGRFVKPVDFGAPRSMADQILATMSAR